MKKVVFGVVLALVPMAQALLVVGDAGSSSEYTVGTNGGAGWNYVGNLIGAAPSSVTYVSNGWFLTANHVWNYDVVGKSLETLQLGGYTYSINTSTYTQILNTDATATDLCMFRATSFDELPVGMAVLESTPGANDALRLIGNGYDNESNTGLTWGDGTTFQTGSGRNSSTYTLEYSDTTCFLSVYDETTDGSAYGQTYDSGGGVFVDGQLAGIMLGVGTLGEEAVTLVADMGTYGEQINAIAAIPEPAVLGLVAGASVTALFVRRRFI
ncbi:trypsin-like serine protease [Pontiella sp.]|uniref:trypsin-like serine protease n=1 Tax=Pontiella sp. TaxID=2837462 RepID=UPI0035698EFD